MSNLRFLLGALFVSLALAFGACGSLSRTGADSAGYEVEVSGLPTACAQSRKDALSVDLYIDNGSQPPIGPFGATQKGDSIKRTFNKNSVNDANLFLETNKCQPLRFCLVITRISPECAAALGLKKGDVKCTGYITPSPCGVWEFDYTDL